VILRITLGELAAAEIVQEIVDVVICDSVTCALMGAESLLAQFETMSGRSKISHLVTERVFRSIAQTIVWMVSGSVALLITAELRLGRMESQLENHKAKIKQGEDRIEFDETGFTQPKIRAILNRHIEERTKMHVTIRDLEQKIEEIYRRNPELKR